MTTMRDYVKDDVGRKARTSPVRRTVTAAWAARCANRCSILPTTTRIGSIPIFPHQAWDMKNWNIANTPMTRSATGGTLPDLARYRLADKPYTVSEYHHPAPERVSRGDPAHAGRVRRRAGLGRLLPVRLSRRKGQLGPQSRSAASSTWTATRRSWRFCPLPR